MAPRQLIVLTFYQMEPISVNKMEGDYMPPVALRPQSTYSFLDLNSAFRGSDGERTYVWGHLALSGHF